MKESLYKKWVSILCLYFLFPPIVMAELTEQKKLAPELYVSFLGAYAATDFRLIYKKTETLSWYGAVGGFASFYTSSYHITGGLQYILNSLRFYGGLGLGHYDYVDRDSFAVIEFKITQKLEHSLLVFGEHLSVQWLGVGIAPLRRRVLGYIELPGIVIHL